MHRFTILVLAALLAVPALAGCRATPSPKAPPSSAGDYAQARPTCAPTSCRVPIYETVMEPVYEKRRVPVCKVREVPVWEWREEPIYGNKYVEIEGYKTRPVMVRRKKPVSIEYQGRCGPEEKCLYCTEECIQVGVERVPASLGYRPVRCQIGSKKVPVLMGYKRVTEPNGCKTECVEVGQRPVRRITGWRNVPLETASGCDTPGGADPAEEPVPNQPAPVVVGPAGQ